MKFFHISDLHLGRQLNGYDLKESQSYMLKQIVEKAREVRPDAIIIAGDVYDKAVPSGEAFSLLDDFLCELGEIRPMIPVMIIAGNHDSAVRLNFASSFLEKHQIFISVMPPKDEDEHLKKVVLEDEFGPVSFYLLPFMKPGYVRGLFPDMSLTYESAFKAVLDREEIDFTQRNVLAAHQFFISGQTGPEKSESELAHFSVGGVDSIDTGIVSAFDYVALGHIHGRQSIGSPHIRYSGTPYKYSVSEAGQTKSITLVEMGEKGKAPEISYLDLECRPDLRRIRGFLDDVVKAAGEKCEDYVSITLTDENPVRPRDRLDECYTRILEVNTDNRQTRTLLQNTETPEDFPDPVSAFADFYLEINGAEMDEEQRAVIEDVVESLKDREESQA